MSGIIRVTPAELEAMAKRYVHEAGEVDLQIGRLDKMISELDTIWDGAASTAFAEQYARLQPEFVKMSELLRSIDRQLDSTAKALRDADQQIASQIRG